MKEHTGTFEAVGSDGVRYMVFVYTNLINVRSQENPHDVIEGLKELRTSEGFSVNRTRKGEYQVVQTGITLRSDSPDAP